MIIAFAGRKQSGKSSASKFLKDEYYRIFEHDFSEQYNYEYYSFADLLKKVCVDILGLTPEQCYGTDDQKNELVNCQWNGKQLSAREVMQTIGSEWFRTMQPNVWADATIRKIQKDKVDLAIIDDCRFPNEVEAIKRAGGVVIKLNRNLYDSNHISEVSLEEDVYDQSNFDLVINNQDMSIEEKNEIIRNFLIRKHQNG